MTMVQVDRNTLRVLSKLRFGLNSQFSVLWRKTRSETNRNGPSRPKHVASFVNVAFSVGLPVFGTLRKTRSETNKNGPSRPKHVASFSKLRFGLNVQFSVPNVR